MIANIEEGGVFAYDFTLIDRDSQPVPLSAMTSLKMTLYDRATDGIINSREEVDILNANGGSFDATSGEGSFTFLAADNPIVTAAKPFETHVALFEAVYAEGTKNWELRIEVKNLNLVP